MDLWGYSHADSSHKIDGNFTFSYHQTTDTIIGVTIATLCTIGVLFNLSVLLTVKIVTKRNCSKARLASSCFIFNLSISDLIYCIMHIFTSVTMLLGGRNQRIEVGGDLLTKLMCNISGLLIFISMRGSLWFLTMLTITRYLAVFYPLKIAKLITKMRLKVVAVIVWIIMTLLSIVPFFIKLEYSYYKDASLCLWSEGVANSRTAKIAYHLAVMVIPIVTPGLVIIVLYLQIICKVIQLKTVHYKLKSGNIDKELPWELAKHTTTTSTTGNNFLTVPRTTHCYGLGTVPEDSPIKTPNTPTNRPPPPTKHASSSRSKKVSFSFSSALSYVKRPLSLIEIERYERETEHIDVDLMDFAVSALDKLSIDPESDEKSYKQGLVAYYVNRFIVKTAGNAAFERIQSNSFLDSNRSLNYSDESCAISLNYYDCPETILSASNSFRINTARDSIISVCEETNSQQNGKWAKVTKFNINQGSATRINTNSSESTSEFELSDDKTSPKLAFIVEEAMKVFLNKSLHDIRELSKPGHKQPSNKPKSTFRLNFEATDEAFVDCTDNISEVLEKHSSSFSDKSKSTSSKFREVANRCRSNSIMEEPRAAVRKHQLAVQEDTSSITPDTTSVNASEEYSPLPNPSQYGTCSENGVCSNSVFYSGTSRLNTVSSNRTNACSSPSVKPTSTPGKLKRSSVANGILTAATEDELSDPPPRKIHRSFSVPDTLDDKSNIRVIFPSFKRFTNTKMKVVQNTVNMRKEKVKTKKPVSEKVATAKRIRRLDMRLSVIIQSALYTIVLVTLFCVCYSSWWVLSVDVLFRYVKNKTLIDFSYTKYCNMLTLSYCLILLNACFNPLIYFYWAYKQAMLDFMRLKYKKYRQSGRKRKN